MKQGFIFILFIVTLASGIGVMQLKFAVSKKVNDLQSLVYQIKRDREDIRILKAEITFRQSPERLEQQAVQFLALMPPRPEQIIVNPAYIPFRSSVETPTKSTAAKIPATQNISSKKQREQDQ